MTLMTHDGVLSEMMVNKLIVNCGIPIYISPFRDSEAESEERWGYTDKTP